MTELAHREDAVDLGGPQHNLHQLMELARVLAPSNLLPHALQGKPADVLITVMYGQELGLSPMQAIQGVYVVKGRPRMSGQLWIAKVRQAGHRLTVSEHTDHGCTVTITRGDTGEEHTETFTLDEAVHAGLVKIREGQPFARSQKGEVLPWESYTKRMLLWRTVSNCATVICPEVALGFELAGAEPPEEGEEKPTLRTVASQRGDRKAEPEPSDEELREQVQTLAAEHTADPEAEAEDPDEAAWQDVLAYEAEQS